MEKPGPRFQPSPLYDPFKRRSQVAIQPPCRAVGLCQIIPADDMRSVFCQFQGILKVWPQVREQWDCSASLAVVTFGFGTYNRDATLFPIDMPPLERQHFGRTA